MQRKGDICLLCSLVEFPRRFRSASCLHRQGNEALMIWGGGQQTGSNGGRF